VDFFATPTHGPAINVGQGTLAASDGFYIRGWTNPPPGQYQLHAEAVDNAGGRGISGSVQIVVIGTDQPTNSIAQTRTWTGADPSGYWSAPANWSPAGVLVNGDTLVFPGGLPPGDMVSTNDLTDRIFLSITFQAGGHTIRGNPITLTSRSDCIINTGTNVIACDLTFSGTPSTPPFPQFGTFTIRGSFGSGELTLSGNVGGGSLIPSLRRLVIRGQFTGGSLRQWAGDLALYGDNPYAVAAEFKNGTLFVQGSQPNLNITMLWEFESAACPNLSGDGVVGDVTGCGQIILDSTLSVKNLGPGAIGFWRDLYIHLNGTNVGEYGRLIASGDVSLSSGRLLPSAGFNPQAGQIYTIVEKTSPGVIANEFLGPEGTVTTLNGMPFRISYIGGDGNDVTLTVEATNTVNAQPTVSIISPTNGAILAAPFGGTIQAIAADSDGTVVRVDFFSDAALVGSVSNAPFNLAVTNIAAGTRALFAVAKDDRGATKRSATVTVTVVTPVPIVLGAVQRPSDTQFVFSYSANVGLRYAVERAVQPGETWSNWTTIRSNTANVNPMTVTDTAATNRMNFYRVRRLPNP
jgi:hypothetical protein